MKTLQEIQQHYIDSCARYGQVASDLIEIGLRKATLQEDMMKARAALVKAMEIENGKNKDS